MTRATMQMDPLYIDGTVPLDSPPMVPADITGSEPSEWGLPSFAVKTNWPMIMGLVVAAGLVAYAATSSPAPRRRRARSRR